MNIIQFYEAIGSNYEAVLNRLGSGTMIKRFVRKFNDDPSFSELTQGFEEKDAEKAFRAAHTLKGVCMNLGFERLYLPATALTEELRGRTFSAQSEELYLSVKKEYQALIDALAELD